MSLRTYKYVAIDRNGARCRGTIRAGDEQDGYKRMVAASLTPLSFEEVAAAGPAFSWQRVNHKDVVGLTRELAVLTEARIPLDRGLVSIAEHEGKRELAAMIRDIATKIESGLPLTAALESYRTLFGEVYIETIRAGEKSGNLSAVMTHLADLLERQMETRQQVRRAMMYPLIVMAVIAVALTVIVVFVVPKFAATFAASGAQMPVITRVIQALGESVKLYWWAYAGSLLGAVGALWATWRRPAGRIAIERFLARVPYIGRIIESVTIGRFARVVSISLSSGLDLIEAVKIGGRSTGRPIFVRECEEMAERLRGGSAFIEVLRGSGTVPGFARRMLGAGKDAAELAKSCEIVARYYDREASHLTKNINTIVEPLMTVAMAGIVLIVALAVFLPMWKMAGLHH